MSSGASEGKRPVEELLKLTGKELIEAAERSVGYSDETAYNCQELIRILEALQKEKRESSGPASDMDFTFSKIFGAACRIAEPAEVDELVTLFVAMPHKTFVREAMLQAVAAPWIQRELKAIEAEGLRAPVFPGSPEPLPEHLQNAPHAVRDTWAYARSVMAPHDAFKHLGEEKVIPFHSNDKAFSKLIDQVLEGRTSGASNRLRRFVWDGMCGTGSEMLVAPKSLAIFMSLLRERRIAEAVGASLDIHPFPDIVNSQLETGPNFRRQFWEMCGLDWERVAIGALLDRKRLWVFRNGRLLEAFGAEGSPSGVRLFISAFPFFHDSASWDLKETFDVLLSDPGKEHGSFRIPPRRERAQALPAEVHRELAVALVGAIQGARDFKYAEDMAAVLSELRQREYGNLIRPLLDHPSEEVAKLAAEALRAMGEEVPALAERPPVRFQLFLNGRPLSSQSVKCTLHGSQRFSGVTVDAKTDQQGIAAIRQSYFLNPAISVARVSFAMRPENRNGLPVPGTEASDFNKGSANEPAQTPFFSKSVPAPASLQALTPVIITTHALTLQFQYNQPPNFYSGKNITVLLTREYKGEDDAPYTPQVIVTRERTPQLVFSSLQPADYSLQIQAPGAATWKASFSLNGSKAIPVKFEAGSDVRVLLKREGEEHGTWARLLRDGRELDIPSSYDDETKGTIYRGLPPGRYMLRVPSSEQYKLEQTGREVNEEQLDKQPEYAGIEIDFEVAASSPSVIDLGEIKIPRQD